MSNTSTVKYYDNLNLPRNSQGEIVIVIDGGPKDLVPLPITGPNVDPNKIPLYPGLNPQNTPVYTLPAGMGSPPRSGTPAYRPGTFATVVSIDGIYKAKKNVETKLQLAIKKLPSDINSVKSKAKEILSLLDNKEYKSQEPFASKSKKISDAILALDKNNQKKLELENKINEQQKLVDKKLDELLAHKLVKLQNFKKFLPDRPDIMDAAFGSMLSMWPAPPKNAKRPEIAVMWDKMVMEPNDRLLDLKNNLITILNLVNVINSDIKSETINVTEEIKKEDNAIKDAVKFTADFYKETFQRYGEKAEALAKDLASQVKGKKIRSVEDALKAYDKYRNNLNKKINAKDREAIAKAVASINAKEAAENFKKFSKGMGYVGKVIDAADLLTELTKAIKSDNWRPFLVKLEAMAAGAGASAAAGFAFSVLLGGPIGILGYALIMAVISALVDDELIEKANKLIGI